MFNRSTGATEDSAERGDSPFRSRGAGAQAPARDRPRPQTAPTTATPSTFGESLRVEGGLSGDVDLQLDGHVKGDVRVARVVVGLNAVVEGSVRAQQAEVYGRVLGSIEAQVVRLYGSAHVEGDIQHGHLAIEGGAYFEGRCQPLRKAGAEPTPEPVSVAPPAAAASTSSAPQSASPMGEPASEPSRPSSEPSSSGSMARNGSGRFQASSEAREARARMNGGATAI